MFPEQNCVYQLITSILHDPFCLNLPWNSVLNNGQPSPFLLLPYHFDRLRAAAAIHGWQDAVASISWDTFQLTCRHAIQAYDGPAKAGPLKVRLHPLLLNFLNHPSLSFLHPAPARSPSRRYHHNHRPASLASDR